MKRLAALLATLLAACSSDLPPLPPSSGSTPQPIEESLEQLPRIYAIEERSFYLCPRPFWPTASRDALVYWGLGELVVLRRDGERRFSTGAAYRTGHCTHGSYGGQLLHVTPDGKTAVMYGITPNKYKNPDFYHPIVEAECAVDLETGSAAPLSTIFGEPKFLKVEFEKVIDISGLFVTSEPRRLFLWDSSSDGLALEVHDPQEKRSALLKVEMESPRCHMVQVDGQVMLACVNESRRVKAPRHVLDLVRFDAREWPPRKISEESITLREIESGFGVKASPDGRLLMYWGSAPQESEDTLAVIDLASGKEVFAHEDKFNGFITTAEIDAQGRGVLVLELVRTRYLEEGRLRYFSLEGEERAAFKLPKAVSEAELYLFGSRDRFIMLDGSKAQLFEIDLP